MPLLVGAVLMAVMLTWRRGTRILAERARRIVRLRDGRIESVSETRREAPAALA